MGLKSCSFSAISTNTRHISSSVLQIIVLLFSLQFGEDFKEKIRISLRLMGISSPLGHSQVRIYGIRCVLLIVNKLQLNSSINISTNHQEIMSFKTSFMRRVFRFLIS